LPEIVGQEVWVSGGMMIFPGSLFAAIVTTSAGFSAGFSAGTAADFGAGSVAGS
jgi:hypothetical protein